MNFADPQFHLPSTIDVLLVDVIEVIRLDNRTDNGVYPQVSKFGWIVSGHVKTTKADIHGKYLACHLTTTPTTASLLSFGRYKRSRRANL